MLQMDKSLLQHFFRFLYRKELPVAGPFGIGNYVSAMRNSDRKSSLLRG